MQVAREFIGQKQLASFWTFTGVLARAVHTMNNLDTTYDLYTYLTVKTSAINGYGRPQK